MRAKQLLEILGTIIPEERLNYKIVLSDRYHKNIKNIKKIKICDYNQSIELVIDE